MENILEKKIAYLYDKYVVRRNFNICKKYPTGLDFIKDLNNLSQSDVLKLILAEQGTGLIDKSLEYFFALLIDDNKVKDTYLNSQKEHFLSLLDMDGFSLELCLISLFNGTIDTRFLSLIHNKQFESENNEINYLISYEESVFSYNSFLSLLKSLKDKKYKLKLENLISERLYVDKVVIEYFKKDLLQLRISISDMSVYYTMSYNQDVSQVVVSLTYYKEKDFVDYRVLFAELEDIFIYGSDGLGLIERYHRNDVVLLMGKLYNNLSEEHSYILHKQGFNNFEDYVKYKDEVSLYEVQNLLLLTNTINLDNDNLTLTFSLILLLLENCDDPLISYRNLLLHKLYGFSDKGIKETEILMSMYKHHFNLILSSFFNKFNKNNYLINKAYSIIKIGTIDTNIICKSIENENVVEIVKNILKNYFFIEVNSSDSKLKIKIIFNDDTEVYITVINNKFLYVILRDAKKRFKRKLNSIDGLVNRLIQELSNIQF